MNSGSMRGAWFGVTAVAVAAMLIGGRDARASQLLAERPVSFSSGNQLFGTGFAFDGFVQMAFGYGFNDFAGGTKPLGVNADLAIGLGTPIGTTFPAFADFTAANSADFAAVTAKLTDHVDEEYFLGAFATLVTSTGGRPEPPYLPFIGQGKSGQEHIALAELQGATIDTIRVVVHSATLTLTHSPPAENFAQESSATWQFFGTPAPEPAAAGVLAPLLAALAAGRRARRR